MNDNIENEVVSTFNPAVLDTSDVFPAADHTKPTAEIHVKTLAQVESRLKSLEKQNSILKGKVYLVIHPFFL